MDQAHEPYTFIGEKSYGILHISPELMALTLVWRCELQQSVVFFDSFPCVSDKQVIKYCYEPPALRKGKFPGSGENMLTKFVLAFSILALLVVFAGTVPAVAHVTFFKAAVVSGTTLQAGEYRLLLGDNKVTFSMGKKSIDVPAKIEQAPKKFDNTEVQYNGGPDQNVVREITLGGTKTRVLFN
jgi:hypothetical protein